MNLKGMILSKARDTDKSSTEETIILNAINEELSNLENFPLTEMQQFMVNYLRSNVEEIVDIIEEDSI